MAPECGLLVSDVTFMRVYVILSNVPRVSASISDEQAELIEDLAGDDGLYDSKSEVLRECISAYNRVQEVEAENERLRRERRQLLDQREERNELVRYAEDQREQEQRARERREQPVWTRMRWWILGEPSN